MGIQYIRDKENENDPDSDGEKNSGKGGSSGNSPSGILRKRSNPNQEFLGPAFPSDGTQDGTGGEWNMRRKKIECLIN